jgi:hypothetical protein
MTGARGMMYGTMSFDDALLIEQFNAALLSPWTVVMLTTSLSIAFLAPNCAEIFSRYDPVIGRVRSTLPRLWQGLQWRPTTAWGLSSGVLATLSILYLGGATEFLYFQF